MEPILFIYISHGSEKNKPKKIVRRIYVKKKSKLIASHPLYFLFRGGYIYKKKCGCSFVCHFRGFSVDVCARLSLRYSRHTFSEKSFEIKKTISKWLPRKSETQAEKSVHILRQRKVSTRESESKREREKKSVNSLTINRKFMFQKHKMNDFIWLRFKIDVYFVDAWHSVLSVWFSSKKNWEKIESSFTCAICRIDLSHIEMVDHEPLKPRAIHGKQILDA